MAEGHSRDAWNHTAQLLAMVYNAHRGKGARAMKPLEFHPFAGNKQASAAKTKDLSILKQVFVDRKRMANSQAIRAGMAFVELFANDSRLVRGLKAASAKLKAWGASVTAMGRKVFAGGLAIAAPLAAATKTFAAMGDTVAKMSLRTGVSAESLSELGFAAEQSGSDLETFEKGLRIMQRGINDAGRELSTQVDALKDLGLSYEDLAHLAPEQQFKRIAERMSRIEDPSKRAALAMMLLGRAGTQLLPLMQDGAAGIEALQKQARELGLTISTEDANAAAQLTDAMNILWRVFKQGVFVIGSALAPVMKDFAERAARIIKNTVDWVRQNKELIVTIFKVAAAVMAGGAALIVLGGLLSGLGTIFGMLATVAAGVGTALAAVGTVLGAILSPIGLVAAAVASLAGYFLYVSGAGERALSWLGRQFNALRDTAIAAWRGISDALAAGDIALAAKVLWLTLKMEWQKGIAWLTDKWIAFKEALMAVWTEAVYGTAKILTSAWAGIQAAWVETVAFMSKAWTIFTSGLVTGWRTAQNWIAKKFVDLMAMFDDSVDVEGAQKILDEDFQREQRQREARTQEQLREIETTRQARQKTIDEAERGTLGELDKEKNARHTSRKKQYDADLKASEDAVKQARKDWQAALDEAAQKRAAIAEETAPGPMKKLGDLEGMDIEGLGKKASVQGTFNAMAARGLDTGGPAERTARGVEEVARNTKELVKEAKLGGLVFA